MFVKFLLFALFHFSSGVIYELSDEEYARMPPMFRMDDYEGCFEDPQGLYCSTKFAMVSDEPSPLLTTMQEYSEHYPSHYNHTLLRRGICITRTCKKYYDVSEGDLGSALEACANETFYNEYKLKTRVLPDFDCAKRDRNHPIGYLDIAVAVVCIAILVANVVASFGDLYFEKERYKGGVRYLYCFSVFNNWKRLVTSPAAGRHPHLTAIHGMRALTMFLVIGCHSVIKNVIAPENARFIENMYNSGPMHILFNGSLVMQTYMFISSFLLVYNWLIHSEKQKPTWKLLPHVFLIRWLRLTPSYALFLAITATWYGKFGSGPAWQSLIGNEMSECRRVWWMHLLYINNYNDNPDCMLHTWYLAADTQLYLMAAIVFLLCRTVLMRKVVLSLLFMIGLAIPTVITYLRNLDGSLLIYPEYTINIFKGSPTFNDIYQRAHTNIPGYIFGMAVAYWVYDRQTTGTDLGHIRGVLKYRLMYWALVPLAVLVHYSGTLYYSYSPPSTFVNLLCAAFMKPTYAVFIGIGVAGTIFRIEDIYRTILEWPIWTIPSRLSFSAYLLHFAILRTSLVMQTTTFTASPTTVITSGLVLIAQSVVAGFFYYLLVEGPFTALVREFYRKLEPIDETKDKDSKKKEDDNEIHESIKANGTAIIADKSARKRVFNKVIDENTSFSAEKNR